MIRTQVMLTDGSYVAVNPLHIQGKNPRDRSALYREFESKVEGHPHLPVQYMEGGKIFNEVCAAKLRLSKEPQVVNAPDVPVVYLGTVDLGSPDNEFVTVFTRPLGPYERNVKKASRVFLIGLDTGRWMQFYAWDEETLAV